MLPTTASAEDVTLKSADGTVDLVGEFVALEDGVYILRTVLGDIRVAASRVRCEGAACPTFDDVSADVQIAGSDAIGLGMMPLLMNGFASTMDAEVEMNNVAEGTSIATLVSDGGFGDDVGSYIVASSTDDSAFSSLLEKDATIGMSSRRITRDEARALRASGAGSMVSPAQERIVAIDNVVVVTHPSNPVQELTNDQLRGIFSGQIRNWSEVGGNDQPINVVLREDGSSSHEYFMNYLYEGEAPKYVAQAIGRNDQDVSNVVYADRYAIGYVGFAFQRGTNAVNLVNECGITISPDAFGAKTEEYDLSRRMYLYSRGDTQDEQSKDLLDYIVSASADNVIAKSGFIDLGVTRNTEENAANRARSLEDQLAGYNANFEGQVAKEMLEQMKDYDRLSTTFRFRTGSSKVDERGRFDMVRLIDFLEGEAQGTKVTFVGFTDDVGAFEGNRHISEDRANALMNAVSDASEGRLSHIQMASAGYGEIAPAACNATERGRAINRRVEVWVSKEQKSF
ncbi:MAG: phosphate ABC transporter substrate-binding/OmpA family protein [Pseudomonadota bacterium]